MKYRICPHCGAHLDYGEKCDCEEKREQVYVKPQETAETPPFSGVPVQMVIFTAETGKAAKTA